MIEGATEAYEILKRYPDRCQKIITKALRKAVASTVKRIKADIPYPDARRLAKSKVKTLDKVTVVRYGLFGKKQSSEDRRITPWMEAYWANYGTLQHRDPEHQFRYPIKNKPNRKNSVGQPAQNFFRASVEGETAQMRQIFILTVIKEDQNTAL